MSTCDVCNKSFTQKKNLRRHVYEQHTETKKEYPCNECLFVTPNKSNLKRHKINQHSEFVKRTGYNTKCSLCPLVTKTTCEMKIHYVHSHNIEMEKDILNFITEDDFLQWKLRMEKETNHEFIIQHSKKRMKDGKTFKMNYVCHRSGFYKPHGMGIKRLKALGSNKINGYCPARIDVTLTVEGVTANFSKTHVGHQSDVGRLRFTPEEKQMIAEKLSSNIPLDTILDEIRTSGESARIRLITKKDLQNIKKCGGLFNKNNNKTDAPWRDSTDISNETPDTSLQKEDHRPQD